MGQCLGTPTSLPENQGSIPSTYMSSQAFVTLLQGVQQSLLSSSGTRHSFVTHTYMGGGANVRMWQTQCGPWAPSLQQALSSFSTTGSLPDINLLKLLGSTFYYAFILLHKNKHFISQNSILGLSTLYILITILSIILITCGRVESYKRHTVLWESNTL